MDDIDIRVKSVAELQALDKSEASLKRLGDTADATDRRLARAGDGADRMGGRIEDAGERADTAETRFTGLASGIDGVTSIMDSPTPQEFAQAIADMADGAANSLAPALANVRDKLFGTTEAASSAAQAADGVADSAEGASRGISGLGKAALTAAGIGGFLALGMAIDGAAKAAREAKFEDQIKAYEQSGDAAQLYADALDDVGSMMRFLAHTEELAATNGAAARDMIEDLRNEGLLTAEQYEHLSTVVEENSNAFRVNAYDVAAATEALRSHGDAVAAQFDPMMQFIDAQRQNQEALRAVNEAEMLLAAAIDEHGANSVEAMVAQQALTDAQWANVESANNAALAAHTLAEGFNSGEIRGGAFEARLRQLADAGLLDAASMGAISRETGIAIGELQRIAGIDPNINITSNTQQVIGGIGALQTSINNLRGKDVHIRYVGTSVGVHAGGVGFNKQGGITGAAAGGLHSGFRLVGENGPELAKLPPGTAITPATSTAERLRRHGQAVAAGAGGVPVVVHVHGSVISERELLNLVQDAQSRGALR